MDFELRAAIAILERTPSVLRAMLGGLGAEWLDANEQGENRRFTPFDRFAQMRESRGQSLAELLGEFSSLRAENLTTLAGWKLSDEQLALEGEHPKLGAVTLRQLLSAWVVHDLGHIAQIARVMAKQYRDAVGPWREYLPVLDR